MTKRLLLFSGGVESLTSLNKLITKYGNRNILCAIFDYKNNVYELKNAISLCKEFEVDYVVLSFNLEDVNVKNFRTIYDNENQTFAPDLQKSRNATMVSMAISLAYDYGISVVYIGYEHIPATLSEDCNYIDAVNDLINNTIHVKDKGIKFKTIVFDMDKADCIAYLANNDLLDEVCYCTNTATKTPCGKCTSCKEHEEALKKIREEE